jgi:hypothetical protein
MAVAYIRHKAGIFGSSKHTGLGAASVVAPSDAAFAHRNEFQLRGSYCMGISDRCKCGAVIPTPFHNIACVVCGSALQGPDAFPSQSVVVGPALATVPGCGTFDSSKRSPGTTPED